MSTGTKVNQLVRQTELNEQLDQYMPFLTTLQKKALQEIAWLDEYPDNKQQWAKLLGISRFAFYKWLTSYNFIQALKVVTQLSQSIHIPKIVSELHKRAKTNKDDCKIVLEYQQLVQTDAPRIVTNNVTIGFITANRDKIKQLADQLVLDSLVDVKTPDDVIEGQIEVE